MPRFDEVKFSDLLGKTLVSVEQVDNYELIFTCTDGSKYRMSHHQDCCASVTIEDICGELDDIVGSPILQADESTSGENPKGIFIQHQDSFTWTFYRIATVKGYVVIRWYGESNGYYSESVYFERVA